MRIVLGGSRHLEFIPNEIADQLFDWMENSTEFLIGDAPGTDRAFQKFLHSKKYSTVTIYSSAGEIRNNLGNWQVEKVESGLKSKSNAAHAFKDRKMSRLADIGLMIWDSQSAGTLSNVIDLVDQQKECYMWLAAESELCRFDNLKSLDKFLLNYPEQSEEAKKRLKRFRNREMKSAHTDEQTLF